MALGFPVAWAPTRSDNVRAPQCSLPAATVAGAAELSYGGYTINGPWVGCYPEQDSDGLVTNTTAGRTVTLVSDGLFLQNSNLTHRGQRRVGVGVARCASRRRVAGA